MAKNVTWLTPPTDQFIHQVISFPKMRPESQSVARRFLASQIQWRCRHSYLQCFGSKTAVVTAELHNAWIQHVYSRRWSAQLWGKKLCEMQDEVIRLYMEGA